MNKNLIVGIASLIVIIGAVILYGVTRPTPVTTTINSSYKENAAYYTISAQYATSTPLFSGAGARANTAAVMLMKQFVDDEIAQFKKDGNFANLSAEDVNTLGLDSGRKEDLQISYLISSSKNTVSYIFQIYTDTLGAHGNTDFRTFTFDLKSGAELKLADLFVSGTPYLDKLSSISRAELPKIIGKDLVTQSMLEDGTTPKDENFANFFLDGTSLVIQFSPYAVAPYSAGPQTLAIPTSELKDILKPEYQ